MSKLKKTMLGVAVAGFAFGISAFTTIKNSTVYVYYKKNLTYPNANDPKGYVYYSTDRCNPGGTLCKARWDIGSNPAPANGDELPEIGVTFQTGSAIGGHFE